MNEEESNSTKFSNLDQNTFQPIPSISTMMRGDLKYEEKPFSLDDVNDLQLEAILKFKLMNENERHLFRTGEAAFDIDKINTAELALRMRMKYNFGLASSTRPPCKAKAPSFKRKPNNVTRNTETSTSENREIKYEYPRKLHRRRRRSSV